MDGNKWHDTVISTKEPSSTRSHPNSIPSPVVYPQFSFTHSLLAAFCRLKTIFQDHSCDTSVVCTTRISLTVIRWKHSYQQVMKLQKDPVFQGWTFPNSSIRSRQTKRHLQGGGEGGGEVYALKWTLFFNTFFCMESSLCHIRKTHWVTESKGNLRNTNWQQYAQKAFFKRKLIKYVAQLFFTF